MKTLDISAYQFIMNFYLYETTYISIWDDFSSGYHDILFQVNKTIDYRILAFVQDWLENRNYTWEVLEVNTDSIIAKKVVRMDDE